MKEQKQKKNEGKLWQQLLLTIFGTTISIILTFGTAHVVNNQKNRKDGRETAMLLIHDIEDYTQFFEALLAEEEKEYNVVKYVMDNIKDIDSMDMDTLLTVAYYITDNESDRFVLEDNIERIFQSSQESWKNINSTAFIDEIRNFFSDRRSFIEQLNKTSMHVGPVNFQELVKISAGTWQNDWDEWMRTFVVEKLQQDDVKFFIARSSNREYAIKGRVNDWKNKCERCKFMMGITEEEMEAFLLKRKQTGKRIKERQLIGRWRTVEDEPNYIEYRNDHTFRQEVVKKMKNYLFTGELRFVYVHNGQWQLKGDTLYRSFERGRRIEMDESGISYPAELKDSVEQLLSNIQTRYSNDLPAQKDWVGEDIVRAAVIDERGRKIELRWTDDNDIEQYSYYIKE